MIVLMYDEMMAMSVLVALVQLDEIYNRETRLIHNNRSCRGF